MSMWNSGSNPTIPEYTYGDKINLKAQVHNTGDAAVTDDVLVYFYEGNPDAGGAYIGSATITGGIAQGGAKTAVYYGYSLLSSSVDIYVKVDPSGSIFEKNESNNLAFRTLSIGPQNFDSDNDGLSDYDESNGMRTIFGIIDSNPNNQDTDGDGLTDGEEMGTTYPGWYYLKSYPRRTDSDNDTIADSDEPEFGTSALNEDSDNDKLKDGFELEIGTDPMSFDTDSDGYEDYDEYYNNWFGWYSPLVYEKENYGVLEIARDIGIGFALGEFGSQDFDSIFYFAGWMLAGVAEVGDIRDIVASIVKGDGPGALLNAFSLFIPGPGDLAKISGKITKFSAQHPNMAFTFIAFTLKYIHNSIDVVKAAYKDIDANIVEKLNAKGFSDNVIVSLFRQGIDLKRFDDILTNSKIYEQFPGLPNFVREKLTRDGEILKDRVTFDVKKMTSADMAGRSTAGYLANLKGAYTEYLASVDIAGTALIGVKKVNKGGIDYAAKEGNTLLKIVEAKARQSLSVKDLKNYIKTDTNGIIKEFNVNYVIKDLGEDYFNPEKNPNLKKQFVLYLNGPNSQDIMKNLNLPSKLPYEFTSKNLETRGQLIKGTIEIVVTAVNK